MLNKPLTEEKLLALKQAPNENSPGTDRLPSEVFGRYVKRMLPTLLKVYNGALESGKLPRSARVILIKLGKDALLVDLYRPISLLTSDVKLLARVLASRLSKVKHKIVRRDQCDFIPTRYTDQNLRHIFLNLQMPIDNTGNGAIFLLGASNAFDSVEWSYLWEVLEWVRHSVAKSALCCLLLA